MLKSQEDYNKFCNDIEMGIRVDGDNRIFCLKDNLEWQSNEGLQSIMSFQSSLFSQWT